jgi:hypothetical protein
LLPCNHEGSTAFFGSRKAQDVGGALWPSPALQTIAACSRTRFLDVALPGLADDRPNGDERRMQPHERPGERHNGDLPKRPLSWWLILIIFALFGAVVGQIIRMKLM